MDEKLRECPFCGGSDLSFLDCTSDVDGFSDYQIRCNTCRAYMDSPSTTIVRVTTHGPVEIRNDETKAKAKRELVNSWNKRSGERYEKLKELMTQMGISQNELGRMLELPKSRMSEFMNGKREFKWSQIKRICDILGIDDPFGYFD